MNARRQLRKLTTLLVLCLIILHISAAYALSAVFTVDSTLDGVDAAPGDGICATRYLCVDRLNCLAGVACTLRAAIQETNKLEGADEIIVPEGEYKLVFAGFGEEIAASDDLDINGNLTITGAGRDRTIITTEVITRIFHIKDLVNVEMSGVTVQNGKIASFAPYAVEWYGGAGIFNQGTLTLNNCKVADNTAVTSISSGGPGGGILNFGMLTINNCLVDGNRSNSIGGGIYNTGGATLVVNNSMISRNNGSGEGGGIFNSGVLNLKGSTIYGNSVGGRGGGLAISYASATITNSTISGNTATWYAGGMFSIGPVYLNNVTITKNSAPASGGTDGGTFAVRNSIISGNTPNDCGYLVDSLGYNLFSDTCRLWRANTGDIIGELPLLNPLADNGGPTPTHSLLPGSPAIDKGDSATCEALDQRGIPRPQGDRCDMGAYELEQGPVLSLNKMLPIRAGNTGPVLTLIYGSGFKNGAAVKLVRSGEADITGNKVTVDELGSFISASFGITDRAEILYDLVVRNPDGGSVTLSNAFKVDAGGYPYLWADILGRGRIVPGRPGRFRITFGNRGNAAARGVPLVIGGIPKEFDVQLKFQITPPPAQDGQVPSDWGSVPINVADAFIGNYKVLPLLLPVVPAGFTGVLEITITAPIGTPVDSGLGFNLRADIGEPYFEVNVRPEVVDVLKEGVKEYLLRTMGVTVPPEFEPELEQYLINQLRNVVENGTTAWINHLGTKGEVYSSAQLLYDAARFVLFRLE